MRAPPASRPRRRAGQSTRQPDTSDVCSCFTRLTQLCKGSSGVSSYRSMSSRGRRYRKQCRLNCRTGNEPINASWPVDDAAANVSGTSMSTARVGPTAHPHPPPDPIIASGAALITPSYRGGPAPRKAVPPDQVRLGGRPVSEKQRNVEREFSRRAFVSGGCRPAGRIRAHPPPGGAPGRAAAATPSQAAAPVDLAHTGR